MVDAKFFFSRQYGKALEDIEDFIFQATASIEQVGSFLDEHDRVLQFIAHNPGTPANHPATGDQSWIFSDGRYRIFFRSIAGEGELHIFMTDIIDNRQANLRIYPENSLPIYQEEEE